MYSSQRAFLLFLCGVAICALLWLASCGRAAEAPHADRIAVLPFEYQGDDATARWLAPALTLAVYEQMRGGEGHVVFPATDTSAAIQRGAAKLLRGIVSGGESSARLRLYVETLSSGEVMAVGDHRLRTLPETLAEVRTSLESLGYLASTLSTSSAEAFASFGKALANDSDSQSIALLQDALRNDPLFSSASLRLAARLAQAGRKDEATSELERLLGALPEDRALERGYAALELATLRGDTAGIVQGLEAIVAATPDDIDAATRLAQIYHQRRRYADASRTWRRVVELEPGNPSTLNQIVYAEAYGGRKAEALEAAETYRRAAPGDVNVDDTLGDVHYFFGDFRQAAASYRKVHEQDPQFLNGFSLFKAAWALLQAGDFDNADAGTNTYIGALRVANAPLADLRAAQWQFLRGRREEARSSLLAILSQKQRYPAPFMGVVASQLYLWDIAEQGTAPLLSDFASRKARYGTQMIPALGALLQAARPGISPAERANAVSSVVSGSQQAVVVAVAVFLDARESGTLSPEGLQAIALADQQVAESGALISHALLGWGFLQRGEPREAAEVFSRRIPPTTEDDGLLWPLVFPASAQWETDAWEQIGEPPPVPSLEALAKATPGPFSQEAGASKNGAVR